MSRICISLHSHTIYSSLYPIASAPVSGLLASASLKPGRREGGIEGAMRLMYLHSTCRRVVTCEPSQVFGRYSGQGYTLGREPLIWVAKGSGGGHLVRHAGAWGY